MAYKTFSKEEIKGIGYDLLAKAVDNGEDYSYMDGVAITINTILSKFEEEVNTVCSK